MQRLQAEEEARLEASGNRRFHVKFALFKPKCKARQKLIQAAQNGSLLAALQNASAAKATHVHEKH